MHSLTDIQFNILIASIMGDGEITKIYKNSRRKNHSYREHYGATQEDYRKWKVSFFDHLLYITPKSHSVRSSSLPLFTSLYPHFYKNNGTKQIPVSLLHLCNLPHFLCILYMDDGSLSISNRINHNKKLVYLTPHIYLYLQCYTFEELSLLNQHLRETFNIIFRISTRKDGQGFILKTTSVTQTYRFLDLIFPVAASCESMYYKTSWSYRFAEEKKKWHALLPDYHLIASNSARTKPYTEAEIQKLIELKEQGWTIQKIADDLHRSYWSITAKWRDINTT